MPNLLKLILQSSRDSNYLTGKCSKTQNGEILCESILLENGLKLKEQLLKQWIGMSTTWITQCENIQKIERNIIEDNRISFLKSNEFQTSYMRICKEKLVSRSNSIALKAIYNNVIKSVTKEHFSCGPKAKTLLVTNFFLASESALSRFYNLQRERKIWWMRFSANPSRYWVEPFDICLEEEARDDICNKSKSITIKSNFSFGLIDMESISLVPLYELDIPSLPSTKDFGKISLIRSTIDLDLTTSDAYADKTKYRNNALMLNRKLAPFQVLLANFHEENTLVDELTLHLQHVINNSGLRLFDKCIHIKSQGEHESELMRFDSLGIPYILLVDDESIKTGFIKLRCRDTTLFETIHISDIPNYLLKIFKQ